MIDWKMIQEEPVFNLEEIIARFVPLMASYNLIALLEDQKTKEVTQ
jgi:hypothetical protein